MKLVDFLDMMERHAPRSYAYEGDNVGLLVGTDRTEIRRVLVALDCTERVAREAVELDVDLVLTHHPLFYHPVQGFRPDLVATRAAYILARHGIGMFAAHTNLDAAPGGVNDCLAKLLDLTDVTPLEPERLGRVGRLTEPLRLDAFLTLCEKRLHTHARYGGDLDKMICKVAVMGGSGGGDVYEAFAAGADVFVTGEVKHSQAIDAAHLGLALAVLGHYETEKIVLEPLIQGLQSEKNDVQYYITRTEVAPLACYEGGTKRNDET